MKNQIFNYAENKPHIFDVTNPVFCPQTERYHDNMNFFEFQSTQKSVCSRAPRGETLEKSSKLDNS